MSVKIFTNALTLALLGFLVWPTPIAGERIVVVCGISLLIITGTQYETPILANTISGLLGDVSYIFYLVHWPAIEFYKFYTAEIKFHYAGKFKPLHRAASRVVRRGLGKKSSYAINGDPFPAESITAARGSPW